MTMMISAPAAASYNILFTHVIPRVLNEAANVLSLSVAITFAGLAIASLIENMTESLLNESDGSTLALLNIEGCEHSDFDDNFADELAYSSGIKV